MERPRIALTLGDVAGTGPELVARVLADARLREWCRPVVVGDCVILRRALDLVRAANDVEIVELQSLDRAGDPGDDAIGCLDVGDGGARHMPAGTADPRAGRLAYQALEAAIDAALAGEVDAIVTAPLNKAALHAAGVPHPGHTEILAERCGVEDFAMMLYLPPGDAIRGAHGLGVAHVTLHTSIASVPAMITTRAVRETIDLVEAFVRQLGVPRPRIGVCALNPHAGEQGLFGDEESTRIAPAVAAAREAGLAVAGPFPADTLLMRAVAGEFDGVVAMYHDQGHIALKLLDFHRAVNVTLGLPIVRTSASQGTAFDIAWQGIAKPDGMLEAVRVASLLAASGDRGR